MLKKVSLVAVVAVAGALTAGGIAFADDDSSSGYTLEGELIQHVIQECEKNVLSGALTIPHDDDSYSKSNDDADCDQDVSPEDD